MIKLVLTILATIVLLVHMRPIGHLADVELRRPLRGGELRGVRIPLIAEPGAAVIVLL